MSPSGCCSTAVNQFITSASNAASHDAAATDAASPCAADGAAAEATLAAVAKAGVDLGKLAETLQIEGRDSFNKSWADLLAKIGAKREVLAAAG
jgi:hypothetical protein